VRNQGLRNIQVCLNIISAPSRLGNPPSWLFLPPLWGVKRHVTYCSDNDYSILGRPGERSPNAVMRYPLSQLTLSVILSTRVLRIKAVAQSGAAHQLTEPGQVKELSERLRTLVEVVEPRLHQISEAESMHSASSGGWSRKQVLGHLIDSASNNHQRFVRATLQPSLDFPGYDQDGNVRVQAIQEAEWSLLVSLWAAYNRYLAHLIAHLPAYKLDTPCRIGAGEAVTLAFLVSDYLTHLGHHLGQIGVGDSP
jgi:DinB superfamily